MKVKEWPGMDLNDSSTISDKLRPPTLSEGVAFAVAVQGPLVVPDPLKEITCLQSLRNESTFLLRPR